MSCNSDDVRDPSDLTLISNNNQLEPSWLGVSPPGSYGVMVYILRSQPNGFVTRSTNTGNFDFGRIYLRHFVMKQGGKLKSFTLL